VSHDCDIELRKMIDKYIETPKMQSCDTFRTFLGFQYIHLSFYVILFLSSCYIFRTFLGFQYIHLSFYVILCRSRVNIELRKMIDEYIETPKMYEKCHTTAI
jgi:hypothetical protein